ncbi:MAG: AMP phosphorylase [Candidatus Micrarchaeia archaeon]
MKARLLNVETGAMVIQLNPKDASRLGIHAGDRVELKSKRGKEVAIVNLSTAINEGELGLTKDIEDETKIRKGEEVELALQPMPSSIQAIRNRLAGRRLDAKTAYEVIRDIVKKRLDREEIVAFITSLHYMPLDLEEAANLSYAMVKTGDTLHLNKKRIFDKHSIGGVPGDKTSLLVVPIVAAAGLTIPKTSSRAITSAAGTADRAEVLMPVTLEVSEVERVVRKTNGCLVWGGAVHLAPADDIFIREEYPLSIDPLLLPSIMSKKKAVGSTDMVLDIPIGAEMKVKSEADGVMLVRDFAALGARMGIRIEAALTAGSQPIGYAVGAAAEAREALETITGKSRKAMDLIDKATSIAGILLEMSGKKNGKKLARSILDRGLAEKKLREIIAEQGGNEKVKPEDIALGDHTAEIVANEDGFVLGFDNIGIATATKLAGAPTNKSAAILLNKKLFDPVKKGEVLLTIYSDSAPLLHNAEKYVKENPLVLFGQKNKALLKHIRLEEAPQRFILER